jgi:hypothetical protein
MTKGRKFSDVDNALFVAKQTAAFTKRPCYVSHLPRTGFEILEEPPTEYGRLYIIVNPDGTLVSHLVLEERKVR